VGDFIQLPATSQQHYLTGQAALNVPYEDNTFADWHFDEVFLSGRGRFRVAGQDFPDTSHLLGAYGIRECGGVLRRYGVKLGEGEKVYAANHVRAVLDLVVSTLSKGKIPAHVTVADTLDSEESLKDFREQLDLLKKMGYPFSSTCYRILKTELPDRAGASISIGFGSRCIFGSGDLFFCTTCRQISSNEAITPSSSSFRKKAAVVMK